MNKVLKFCRNIVYCSIVFILLLLFVWWLSEWADIVYNFKYKEPYGFMIFISGFMIPLGIIGCAVYTFIGDEY